MAEEIVGYGLASAHDAGPHGYLVKPFDERDLHTTIEVALYKGKIDRALVQSREDLLMILNAQRQGCVFIDEDGLITFINRAAEAMFELAADSSLHQQWADVLPMQDASRAKVVEELRKLPVERSKFSLSVQAAAPRETTTDVEILDEPRSPDRKILFFYDVTELHTLRRISDVAMPIEKIVGAMRVGETKLRPCATQAATARRRQAAGHEPRHVLSPAVAARRGRGCLKFASWVTETFSEGEAPAEPFR